MPEWEDLGAFMAVEDFATTAIDQQTDARFPVILDEQVMSHELGTYDINAASPSATAKAVDVVGLKKRHHLSINGVTYWLVRDPLPDGTGLAILELSRSEYDGN